MWHDTGGPLVEFRLQHTVVVGSISSGGDHGVHCRCDIIRSKQLFGAPHVGVCRIFLSWYKLDEPEPQYTAGEARTNSSVMYSYGPPHMAKQKQDDHTYGSYVRIRSVTQKTCQKRWMIGRSSERVSGISVLAERHDDDSADHFSISYKAVLETIAITLFRHCLCRHTRQFYTLHLFGESGGTLMSWLLFFYLLTKFLFILLF